MDGAEKELEKVFPYIEMSCNGLLGPRGEREDVWRGFLSL